MASASKYGDKYSEYDSYLLIGSKLMKIDFFTITNEGTNGLSHDVISISMENNHNLILGDKVDGHISDFKHFCFKFKSHLTSKTLHEPNTLNIELKCYYLEVDNVKLFVRKYKLNKLLDNG